MLTLSEVAKRLTSGTLLKHMSEDAAKRMIAILRETDQVEIIVGTKIMTRSTTHPWQQRSD
jgi:hypothetical protein